MEIYLYQWELESMPEYSHTIPSGQVPGKWWRCRMRGRSGWKVATFTINEANTELIRVNWLKVVFREGPKPRNYYPPDWSNYAEWKRTFSEKK